MKLFQVHENKFAQKFISGAIQFLPPSASYFRRPQQRHSNLQKTSNCVRTLRILTLCCGLLSFRYIYVQSNQMRNTIDFNQTWNEGNNQNDNSSRYMGEGQCGVQSRIPRKKKLEKNNSQRILTFRLIMLIPGFHFLWYGERALFPKSRKFFLGKKSLFRNSRSPVPLPLYCISLNTENVIRISYRKIFQIRQRISEIFLQRSDFQSFSFSAQIFEDFFPSALSVSFT